MSATNPNSSAADARARVQAARQGWLYRARRGYVRAMIAELESWLSDARAALAAELDPEATPAEAGLTDSPTRRPEA